jgi:hypothetical protein
MHCWLLTPVTLPLGRKPLLPTGLALGGQVQEVVQAWNEHVLSLGVNVPISQQLDMKINNACMPLLVTLYTVMPNFIHGAICEAQNVLKMET